MGICSTKRGGDAARPAIPTGIDRGNWRLRQADTGRRITASLERIGFAGRIFPVNPNYPSVHNRRCYASPAELPEAPDIAVFCLGHERVFSAFEAAAKRGMKAAVIYDGGFAEQGAEGRALQARIAAICVEAGIALCGPNCMGILNPHHNSREGQPRDIRGPDRSSVAELPRLRAGGSRELVNDI